jgi:hypothetical protein
MSAASSCIIPKEAGSLERFQITWNHVIEKESLKFKELEHVLIGKCPNLGSNLFDSVDAL